MAIHEIVIVISLAHYNKTQQINRFCACKLFEYSEQDLLINNSKEIFLLTQEMPDFSQENQMILIFKTKNVELEGLLLNRHNT